ncbi:SprT-like domain-containing protein [Priestia aryabhattai]|uniref:SprT-like domain-containing protein n=1 Tax=Priestia aryabhattai TaxID=412384 RepID=UPI00288196B0|nr:SprT-like domain-containing protein [Priestia aryabhattai]MDT0149995.1 SprT-like domain-containing protein [Priestia aryabhattai]MDT0155565.1 SprT-like domain-containing protein [Priestia aryabhattai]
MTTKTKEINLENTLKELNKAFDLINGYYFQGQLEPVIITVNTSSKANVLGWFTPSKVWEAGEKEYHEINLVAENLRRGKMQVLQTLFHECLHLYNHQNNIKDTSRGNAYHNKRFLATALDFGFEYLHEAPDAKIGYSMVTLTKTTFDTIDSWDLDDKAFDLSRKTFGKGKEKKKTTWKWTCECLPKPQTVRTTKPELRAICPDCESFFTCADDE